jgi:ubiquinone/menaquinone biosynthesis C-methylase UbiE
MAMTSANTQFDADRYKQAAKEQWDLVADAWHRWEPTISSWLNSTTEMMLDMAGVKERSRVLDLAAGSGGQTLVAARRVGPSGYVLATDIAPNIIAFAGGEARQAGLTNVEARVMDAENLELPAASFDIVISRLGLMLLPNLHRTLVGVNRVLKPGGRLAAIVFSLPEKNQFFSIPISIARRYAQLPAPILGQPGPFSLSQRGSLEAAYRQSGFRDVQSRVVSAPLRLPSAADCLRFERESFGAVHQMLSGINADDREAAWEEIGEALTRFEGPHGFEAPCELIIAVGVK